jgi:hypothetical protein
MRMSSSIARRRRPLAVVGAVLASLLLVSPAAAQTSVRAYGGPGGTVETQAGPTSTTPKPPPVVTNTPGQNPTPTPTPGHNPPPGGTVNPPTVPGTTSPPAGTAVPTAAPVSRGLLSLPRTGFTIALLVGAGLLLTGVGLVTRRVASAHERSA